MEIDENGNLTHYRDKYNTPELNDDHINCKCGGQARAIRKTGLVHIEFKCKRCRKIMRR